MNPAATADESRVVRTLIREARPRMLRIFSPDSCIAAARLTVEVLRRFEIPCEPVPVRVRAFTHSLFARLATKTFDGKYRRGDYGIEIGADLGRRQFFFPGHVVVTTNQRLIDLSIDQANRPEHGLTIEPVSFRLQPDWPQSVQTDSAVLMYEKLDDQSFREAPDWNRLSTIEEIIEYVCRKV